MSVPIDRERRGRWQVYTLMVSKDAPEVHANVAILLAEMNVQGVQE